MRGRNRQSVILRFHDRKEEMWERYALMNKFWYKTWKKLLFLWLLWSALLTGYEIVSLKIPMHMYLYEEDAMEVLAKNQSKISPEDLYFDFSGDVEITAAGNGKYEAVCNLFGLIPIKTMEVSVVSRQEIIPGGIPVGIYVQTDGVFVIGTGKIELDDVQVESPAKNILKTGDYITGVQGRAVNSKQELIGELARFQGEEMTLEIRRNRETIEVLIKPVMKEDGAHIGVWVRDDTQGVGTLTYVTADGKFGALGHGISDADSELLMEVSKGKLYDCEIFQITKGEKGNPGKLSGKIVYSQNNLYGDVTGNLSGGIYGTANSHLKESVKYDPMPIALKQEVLEGEATILSSVEGSLREYTVEIKKIHKGERDVNKGMELTVTDEELIDLTGGIVQGMSGSPILQNGRIVGALTHVFVNDPAKGYGIFIEDMLSNSL